MFYVRLKGCEGETNMVAPRVPPSRASKGKREKSDLAVKRSRAREGEEGKMVRGLISDTHLGLAAHGSKRA